MLNLAGVRLRLFVIHTDLFKKTCENMMTVQCVLCDGTPGICQYQHSCVVRSDVIFLAEPFGRIGYTRFGHLELLCHIDGTDITLTVVNLQNGFEIILHCLLRAVIFFYALHEITSLCGGSAAVFMLFKNREKTQRGSPADFAGAGHKSVICCKLYTANKRYN